MIKEHVRSADNFLHLRTINSVCVNHLAVLSGLNLENNEKGHTGELVKVHNGTHNQSSLTRPPGKFEKVVVTRAGRK